MTLKERNLFFKIGLGLAAAAFASFVLLSVFALRFTPQAYPQAALDAAGRPTGFAAALFNAAPSEPYAIFAAITVAVIYAFCALLFIYRFFEKTQSPEILYFGFFMLSFAFEACRALIPFVKASDLPSVYLLIAGRMLLFGRYFGIFSLFAAAIYAAGFTNQEQKYTVILLFAVSAVFALETPIDGFSWNTALAMITGYSKLFSAVGAGIAAITLTTLLVSALTRGTNAYLFVCAGVFLSLIGRDFLLNADIWTAPVFGAIFLIAGTWLIATKLHGVYLWL